MYWLLTRSFFDKNNSERDMTILCQLWQQSYQVYSENFFGRKRNVYFKCSFFGRKIHSNASFILNVIWSEFAEAAQLMIQSHKKAIRSGERAAVTKRKNMFSIRLLCIIVPDCTLHIPKECNVCERRSIRLPDEPLNSTDLECCY